MSIINKDYFNTVLRNIPNTNAEYVQEYVQSVIDTYEPKYLQSVLGYKLYKAFIADLEIDPIPERATNLLTGCEFECNGVLLKWCGLKNTTTFYSPLADYVMVNYLNDNSSSTTGVGESIPQPDHGVVASTLPKIMQLWNNMRNDNKILYLFITQNCTVYPEFDYNVEAGMYKPINYLGI